MNLQLGVIEQGGAGVEQGGVGTVIIDQFGHQEGVITAVVCKLGLVPTVDRPRNETLEERDIQPKGHSHGWSKNWTKLERVPC